ncbi:MAG: hypothetical protein A2000_03940 [Ignavibacteria bacterium GWB2_36_8]|nr:MAG: hypothetical protein A2000_03940 [Ignavibacteria bacterium GWB2_36_8]OGU48097.1 MAG: hypothetical protein A2080_16735 [Ignavibacteria bacterium GWC2_36_12]
MKLNRNQKKTFLIGLLLIAAAFLVWIGFGAEIFTKTQVLIEKKDELLGTTYKEWKDQFVLGLDYALGFIFILSVVIFIIIFKLKDRK